MKGESGFGRITGAQLALFGAFLALLVAVAIVAWPRDLIPVDDTVYPAVAELLPDEKASVGWTKRVRPIAETPEMQARVDELLNFNDAIFVDFTRGHERVSVYIAYWEPKRMRQREVAGHYPDTCWVRAGWDCLTATTEHLALPDGRPLVPVQRRLMTAGGVKETVYFWHLVEAEEGGFFAYRRQRLSQFRDILKFGVNQKRRQYFIRISGSDSSLDPVRWINERYIALLTSEAMSSKKNDA